MPSVSSLPFELLYHILSLAQPPTFDPARRDFLGRLALVSRSWCAVSKSLRGEEEVVVGDEGGEMWEELVGRLCGRREKRGARGVVRRLRIEGRELPLALRWMEGIKAELKQKRGRSAGDSVVKESQWVELFVGEFSFRTSPPKANTDDMMVDRA